MKIHVITPVYNESYLIPFFAENYNFADKFTFLFDEETTDDSRAKLNIEFFSKDFNIINFKTDGGIDDDIMIRKTNQIINDSDADWFICVDMDEFIINDNIRNVLSSTKDKFMTCMFYQMYKHKLELDNLRRGIPIQNQRKYGKIDPMYNKPCIIRSNQSLSLGVGKHNLYKSGSLIRKANSDFKGLHLNNLNLQFSINRRIFNRKNRVSANNIINGYSKHYNNDTITSIENEFNKEYEKLF